MSRTVVRVSVFLLAISLAWTATRAFGGEPPKKPADDDPFSDGSASAAPAAKAPPAAKPVKPAGDGPFGAAEAPNPFDADFREGEIDSHFSPDGGVVCGYR